jgi:hypothetical protein
MQGRVRPVVLAALRSPADCQHAHCVEQGQQVRLLVRLSRLRVPSASPVNTRAPLVRLCANLAPPIRTPLLGLRAASAMQDIQAWIKGPVFPARLEPTKMLLGQVLASLAD